MPIPPYMWLKDDGGADITGSVDVQDRDGFRRCTEGRNIRSYPLQLTQSVIVETATLPEAAVAEYCRK